MIGKWTLALIIISLTSFLNREKLARNSSVQDKKLVYRDATYEPEIRTVQLYPSTGKSTDILLPAVTQIGNNNLVLEFDDLVEAPENYKVRLIHCNNNWQPSRLRNLDYLYDYNEFNITQYELSVDTKLAYVHYRFQVPRVKMPGNYLLVAYRGANESDIILSRRFMVYHNSVQINLTSNLMGLTSMNRLNQQLDFKIDYGDYLVENPLENISIVIRQNQRWDNAITNLKPNFIRENLGELEYRFFNEENNFRAGNEFRFFDMRSLRHPGQNVQRVNYQTHPTSVLLMRDQPRIYQPYTSFEDLNGDFFIANADTGNGDVQGDYVTVTFSLDSPPIGGAIYIIGKMNDWDLRTPMTYNEFSKSYQGEMLLKQGYYDYQYLVKGDTLNHNYLEGDHYETENEYEIFVYYTPPTGRADLLIGYAHYEMNPTN